MRIYPEQLPQQLERELSRVYLLCGQEPLFKQEATVQILNKAKTSGFADLLRFQVDSQFNWQTLYDACQAMSLFANQQIIHLTLPDKPMTKAQTDALKELASLIHEDLILILEGGRLTKQQESTQWFKALSQQGLYIPCNPPELKQYPRWIEQRCRQLQLSICPNGIQLLALCHEGNLLALSQTLLKLQLIKEDGIFTFDALKEALTRHNHFSPFQFIDTLIEGNAKRGIRILRQLEAEGTEILLLLRLVQKELIQLMKIQHLIASGTPQSQAFEQFRIWQNKRGQCLKHFNA